MIAREILDYWLGTRPDDPGVFGEKRKRWFTGGRSVDLEIRERFGACLDTFATGVESGWLAGDRSLLAAIIVCDQFSRNVHRGSARAFALDPIAQELVLSRLDSSVRPDLCRVEEAFLYMPLTHAEERRMQQLAVDSFRDLADRHGSDCETCAAGSCALGDLLRSFLDSALEHAGIIDRFGRFPHRNGALGRTSTPAEDVYLGSGGRRFGQ